VSFRVELPDKITPEIAGQYIADDNWVVQEKHNGRHRLITRDTASQIGCFNRDGVLRSISKPFQYALLSDKLPPFYVIDVEEEKNTLTILDVLISGGNDFIPRPYKERLAEAAAAFAHVHPAIKVVESTYGTVAKLAKIQRLHDEKAEGFVLKNLSAVYKQGRAGQHHAVKFWKTVDCFVIELNNRHTSKGDVRDSCDIGVLDANGNVVRVGSSSLIGKPNVVPGEVVEIKCLYSSPEFHLIQPTILRRRDDKLAKDCGLNQVIEIVNKNWR
jgi:hypothetical protein